MCLHLVHVDALFGCETAFMFTKRQKFSNAKKGLKMIEKNDLLKNFRFKRLRNSVSCELFSLFVFLKLINQVKKNKTFIIKKIRINNATKTKSSFSGRIPSDPDSLMRHYQRALL